MGRWQGFVIALAVAATSVANAAEAPAVASAVAAREAPIDATVDPSAAHDTVDPGAPPDASHLMRSSARAPAFLRDAAPMLLRIGDWVEVAKRSAGADDENAPSAIAAPAMSTARLAGQFPSYTRFGSEDVFLRVRVPLQARFSVWTEYHSLRLSDPADPWFVRGGSAHPEAQAFSGALLDDPRPHLQLLELGLTLKLREHVNAHARYGRAFGAGTGGAAASGSYGYLELSLHF